MLSQQVCFFWEEVSLSVGRAVMAGSTSSQDMLASRGLEGELKQQAGSREPLDVEPQRTIAHTLVSPQAAHAADVSTCTVEPVWPNSTRNSAILQPLSFPEAPKRDLSLFMDPVKDQPIHCLICDQTFFHKDSKQSREGMSLMPSETDEGRQSDLDGRVNVKPVGLAGREERVREKNKEVLNLEPKDEWLRHLLLEHKIVVHQVSDICSLKW